MYMRTRIKVYVTRNKRVHITYLCAHGLQRQYVTIRLSQARQNISQQTSESIGPPYNSLNSYACVKQNSEHENSMFPHMKADYK